MSFNYRVPLLTHALNWERTIYPTPSARVPLKASLGGKACHWDVWCSETGVILGGRPPPQNNSTACTGMTRMDKWPTPESPLAWTGQWTAALRSNQNPVGALQYRGACHGAVFPFLLLSMIYQCDLAFVFVLSSCLHLDRQYGQLLKH